MGCARESVDRCWNALRFGNELEICTLETEARYLIICRFIKLYETTTNKWFPVINTTYLVDELHNFLTSW